MCKCFLWFLLLLCVCIVSPGFYICSPRLIYWLLIMATASQLHWLCLRHVLLGERGNVCYHVRYCCHLGVCDKLPNWAGVRQMKQAASETGFLRDGHVIMLSLIGYKLNKQIKESTSTLINRSLDRRYFSENLLIIVEVTAIWKPWKLGNFTF